MLKGWKFYSDEEVYLSVSKAIWPWQIRYFLNRGCQIRGYGGGRYEAIALRWR